jgi:DNA-binding transcriptional LysR family regulator
LELRHLRYFRVVAEELHFGRAAARLHMEPQPLNFQMKQLERELGFPLLTHKEHRTQLSAAGKIFFEEAERVLAAAEHAVEASARVARGESGVLRLGFANNTMHQYLIPTIKQFREEHPAVSFDLQPYRLREQSEAVRRGSIDLGFGMMPLTEPGLSGKLIARATPRLAVPAADPLARSTSIEWAQLQGREAVAFDPATAPFALRVDAMLAKHGVSMTTVQVAPDFDTVLGLVGIGVGIAIVPNEPPEGRGDVTFVALPADVEGFGIAALWRNDDENTLRDRFVGFLPALA